MNIKRRFPAFALSIFSFARRPLLWLYLRKFSQEGDMPRKAKTATSSGLPSWVDSRQEQGLYFFTREDAIESLQFTEEAFKKAAARLAKKTEPCASAAASSSSSPWNTVPRHIAGGVVYRRSDGLHIFCVNS
jgi:hypothetical protein